MPLFGEILRSPRDIKRALNTNDEFFHYCELSLTASLKTVRSVALYFQDVALSIALSRAAAS
jgi:hypothetical protein